MELLGAMIAVVIVFLASIVALWLDTTIPYFVIGLVGDIAFIVMGTSARDSKVFWLGVILSLVMMLAILFEVRSLIRRGNVFRVR